jgi:hypothetical protein
MDLFFAMVWGGGVVTMPKHKVHLIERIFWPIALGRFLHSLARAHIDREDET